MKWDSLVLHEHMSQIVSDQGLAQIGDGVVNLCYSLAKSVVLTSATGEKVQDRVLANAMRSSNLYAFISGRTDAGRAADAYEAIIAYLWMTNRITIPVLVDILVENLPLTFDMSRKDERRIASEAFTILLQQVSTLFPKNLIDVQ
ncbi:MAG: hypothetical protein BAJATHORv1_20506 [Candidatus Thorarchaeota archaeon]|nr:MAG: hypothetical protein BAJATHORv1_20506 [Candidatus Thorarchaeota archaeon]